MDKLFIIFAYFSICNCNIWDNMFSNINGPNLEIPKEFKLQLTNTASNTTIADLLFSVSLNKIKMILYDKQIASGIIKNLDIALPLITNIYIDFANGKISLDFKTSCFWKNASMINMLKSEFFIKSYDLFTFFEDKTDFYQYVITNPFRSNNTINIDKNFKVVFDEVDKRAIVNFIVNKSRNILEKINFVFKNSIVLETDVKVEVVEKFDENELFFDPKECKELKDINQSIQETPKNSSGKFLPLN